MNLHHYFPRHEIDLLKLGRLLSFVAWLDTLPESPVVGQSPFAINQPQRSSVEGNGNPDRLNGEDGPTNSLNQISCQVRLVPDSSVRSA